MLPNILSCILWDLKVELSTWPRSSRSLFFRRYAPPVNTRLPLLKWMTKGGPHPLQRYKQTTFLEISASDNSEV